MSRLTPAMPHTAPKSWARALSAEVLAYAVASLLALCVDTSILWVLVNEAGWHYLPASALAFTAGASVAYVLSVRFVFRFRAVQRRKLEFLYFVALGLTGLLVNSAALAVAIGSAGLGLLSSKLIAASCTFGTNFALRRQLLFTRHF